jgi:hypothetical protein
LTILEFLGCLIAVLGGAYLGAVYLGVDVNRVAWTALSQAELLDKIPSEWQPSAPPEKLVTREQLIRTLREELGALRVELTALRNNAGVGDTTVPVMDQFLGALPQPATKEKTLAYWKRLNEIAMGESALQQDAQSTFNKTNAARVFAVKGRISRFSAKSVEAIPTPGVDDSVIKFGRQLGLWYERAGELYERAVRIWETPIGNQARAELNEEWKRAEMQHSNEARLLNDKAKAIRGSISRQFGEEFPEFAKPAAAGSTDEAVANAR